MTSKRVVYSHDVIFNESDFSLNPSILSGSSTRDLLTEELDVIVPPEVDVSDDLLTDTIDIPSIPEIIVTAADDCLVVDPPGVSEEVAVSSTSTFDSSLSSSSVPSVPSVVPPVLSSPLSTSVPSPLPITLGKRKTLWSQEPSSSVPRQEISSDIDPRNIIERRTRRANVASAVETPKTYKQAMRSPTRAQWVDAVAVELANMERRGVWSVVELPEGSRAVGTVWVFKTKLRPDRSLLKHMARLCAQGFAQIAGIDFNETYAPTGSKAGLRLLLAIAAAEDLDIESMDAIAAFLNGVPDEEIYLNIPEGLEISNRTDRTVLKVNRSIYGLKQSPRCWYREITTFFLSLNFRACLWDPCLFILNDSKEPCYFHIHVDDLTIAGHLPVFFGSRKQSVRSSKWKNWGPLMLCSVSKSHATALLDLSCFLRSTTSILFLKPST